MEKIVNPFNDMKTNWAKKAQEKHISTTIKVEKKSEIKKQTNSIKKKEIKRVPKSFKIYPGKIPKDFDKRVNKLQVYFDDLDFEKDYVDSGKYIMFLMAFAEKYSLYDLYSQVDENGNFELEKQKLKKFIENLK